MKWYHKHKRGLRHRLIQKLGQQLRFFLYFAVLVLIMIGNNFASFRSEDQPSLGKPIGENYSSENGVSNGDVQSRMTPQHLQTSFNLKFGIEKEEQAALMLAYNWGNSRGQIGQWDKYDTQSDMKPKDGGLWDWENDWFEDLLSYAKNYQENSGSSFSDEGSESFLNPPIEDVNERNLQEQMFNSSIEYPKSNSHGGGYPAGFTGGSGGAMSSGGSGGGSSLFQTNEGPVEVPEPSTFILTAIGLLLVARRIKGPRGQGFKDLSDTR